MVDEEHVQNKQRLDVTASAMENVEDDCNVQDDSIFCLLYIVPDCREPAMTNNRLKVAIVSPSEVDANLTIHVLVRVWIHTSIRYVISSHCQPIAASLQMDHF